MPLPILDMNYLTSALEKSFYTLPLMIFLNALFLVLALVKKIKERKIRILILYGAISLAQDLLGIFLMLANKTIIKGEIVSLIDHYSIIGFTLVEFVILYIYFYHQFQSAIVKHKILMTGKVFLAIALLLSIYVCFFTSPMIIRKFQGYLSLTFSILLLIPSFYYFHTLFIEPPEKDLLKEPSFWITTGIAFLNGLNIPLFFTQNYFLKEATTAWYYFYSINYMAYCVLFILFIISVLCNRNRATLKHTHVTDIC